MTGPSLPTGPDLGMEAHGAPFRVLLIGAGGYSAGLLHEVAAASGLGVDVTRDPHEALLRMRDELFDVVIIDLPNPQVSAEEIYRGILDANLELAEKVVFLANDLSDPATRRFLADAGRPFLTQPFESAQLYDLVMRVGLGEESE